MVRSHREAFAAEAMPDPAAFDLPPRGEVLVAEPRGRPVYSFEEYVSGIRAQPLEPPGGPVQVHNLVVTRRPRAVIEPTGEVELTWTSDRTIVGGRVDFGVRLRSFGVPQRILRKVAAFRRDEDGAYRSRFSMMSLLSPRYDLGSRKSGRGILAIRLRLLDGRFGEERFEDLDVHFSCAGPCSETSPVVQLPSFTLGPVVDRVRRTRSVVSFETDRPTLARVVVFDHAGARTFDVDRVARRHELELDQLPAGEGLRYLVLIKDARGGIAEATEGALWTQPPRPAPFRFAVMSDSRASVGGPGHRYRGSNRQALERLSDEILARGHRFVVFAGDLINGYTTEPEAYRYELEGFVQSVQPFAARVPFYEAIGNHELVMDAWTGGYMNNRKAARNTESVFAEVFVNPTNGPPADAGRPTYEENVYSFDYGNAHIAVLNSNYDYRSHIEDPRHPNRGTGVREGTLTVAQLEWLDADLDDARRRGIEHLFVATHEPAYPAAGHVQDAMYWNGAIPEVLQVRDRFWSILVRHRVLAAFFGDEHAYTRSRIDTAVDHRWTHPIWHVVTGGAGAPYYGLDRTVPWIDAVQAFHPDVHFCEVDVLGPKVYLRVINQLGAVVEELELTGS
jgi:3',5'-cyclic AMP phosphodiesterase CpdA